MTIEFSVEELEYVLPEELIAQTPPPRREDSRLLVVNRAQGSLRDANIIDLPPLLNAGDLLVLNDARVVPARFTAHRGTGGRVGGLFLEEESPGNWRVMLEGSRRLRTGEVLRLGEGSGVIHFRLLESIGEGHWKVQIQSNETAENILGRLGETPLPPYIHRKGMEQSFGQSDKERYQTVYARVAGAVAAPTAGLHLSHEILQRIRAGGTSIAFVTLHVGPGTFKPVSVERLTDHVMHDERFEVSNETISEWKACRQRGGRVVAVGTTVVRALESVLGRDTYPGPGSGSTNLFIYPPYRVTAVDALLTNFHLPRSTLLALVMAFAGVELTRKAYQHAIDHVYRFYSYGDAMFIQ